MLPIGHPEHQFDLWKIIAHIADLVSHSAERLCGAEETAIGRERNVFVGAIVIARSRPIRWGTIGYLIQIYRLP